MNKLYVAGIAFFFLSQDVLKMTRRQIVVSVPRNTPRFAVLTEKPTVIVARLVARMWR